MTTDLTVQNRLRERIRDYLHVTRTTQTSFARMIGRPKSTVSMFLAGKRNLDMSLIITACRIIGITLADLDSIHRGPDPQRLAMYKERLEKLYGFGGPGFDTVAYSIDNWLTVAAVERK